MTTKGKLGFIVGIIATVLCLAAAVMLWNTFAIYRLIKTVDPALEIHATYGEIRSKLLRQQHSLTHFVVSGEEKMRSEQAALRAALEGQLRQLAAQVSRPQASGLAGEDEVKVNLLAGRYAGYKKLVEKCLQFKIAGNGGEALLVLDNEASPYLERELLPLLEGMSGDEARKISETYNAILMNLGALPWVAASGLVQVERTISGVDYALVVSKAEIALYRQMTELLEFTLHGENQDWEEFIGYRQEMRRLLEEWRQVILSQQGLGVAGEDDDAQDLAAFTKNYEDALGRMAEAVVIRRARGQAAGLEYVEHNLGRVLDDQLFPVMTRLGKESRVEVKELHAGLIKSVVVGGAAGIVSMLLLSALLLLLTLRISRGIVVALARLKEGTEIIKSGNLEYRIPAGGGDEFAELAEAFNAMTGALKEHNDELRAFVFSVAHDLRAPLVNLKGFSSELRRDLGEISPALLASLHNLSETERQRLAELLERAVPESLGYIDASTRKLDSLINSVLQLARIDLQTLKPEAVSLEELLPAVLDSFSHAIREKNITVTVGPLPGVVADRAVLEQCVANLLDNAIKYLAPGRAGQLVITAERVGGQVVVYFQDNGRGIAPEDLGKVFEIFRRAGQQDMPGEGMGLAFVKAQLRRQGGNIWCESTLGEGSTFCLAIPASA